MRECLREGEGFPGGAPISASSSVVVSPSPSVLCLLQPLFLHPLTNVLVPPSLMRPCTISGVRLPTPRPGQARPSEVLVLYPWARPQLLASQFPPV